MDFSLNDEQLEWQRRIGAFARERLSGHAREHDSRGVFPRELWRELGEFGLLGVSVPREYGGAGHGYVTTTAALEALGYGCADNGLNFAVACLLAVMLPALRVSSNAVQREKYLPAICRGDVIVCFAATEPDSGSDALAMKTTAERSEAGFKLNGEKWFISFGPIADVAIVFATTNARLGKWGLSALLVERGTPGFTQGAVQEKLGLRAVPMGQLRFENCVVPAENLLGREGAGASIFSSTQEVERALILAPQIGAMQRQIEACVRFANERRANNQPIAKFQAVSHRIAEMKLRLESARLLAYKAASLLDAGKPAVMESALANLQLSEAFVQNSIDAIRTFGARGYVTEFEVERDLRDAMGGPIYSGTSDIQRNIVARMLGL